MLTMNLYLEKGIMGFYAESKSAAGTGGTSSCKAARERLKICVCLLPPTPEG